MRHLLSTVINPPLPLDRCLQQWPEIARRLREPKRKRQRQLERLAVHVPLFS